jgi:GNAT superfamily N-acetyltransferase
MTAASTARPLARPHDAVQLARRSWTLPSAGGDLVARGAVRSDLPLVARMHGRCSADTLLQRYLRGGRAPSLALVSELLTRPLVVVVEDEHGELRAMACGSRPATAPGSREESPQTLQVALIVEDSWQRLGVGTALMRHVAASAVLLGYRELVADAAASGLPLRRVLSSVGPTRAGRHQGWHRLRTRVDLSSLSGLGPTHGALAG